MAFPVVFVALGVAALAGLKKLAENAFDYAQKTRPDDPDVPKEPFDFAKPTEVVKYTALGAAAAVTDTVKEFKRDWQKAKDEYCKEQALVHLAQQRGWRAETGEEVRQQEKVREYLQQKFKKK